MAIVRFEISMSLDGFVAGPDVSLEEGLGRGGEQLHDWVTRLASWRASHGLEGGERGPDSDLLEGSIERTGAVIMGRRMFGGPPLNGPWGDQPGDGWWGEDPPFRHPVFILTHHPRETVVKPNGTRYVFVTDGIESALEQARDAAGEKDVAIAGGASVAQQFLDAGLLDEVEIHLVPLLLGGGTRLFDGQTGTLEPVRVVEGRGVAHLTYRPTARNVPESSL